MQLPNKLYSYKNSTLALIPLVLNEIKEEPVPVYQLFWKIKPHLNDATDFLSVMPNLNTDILASLPVSFPSYSDQVRQAKLFQTIDDKIFINHLINDNLAA